MAICPACKNEIDDQSQSAGHCGVCGTVLRPLPTRTVADVRLPTHSQDQPADQSETTDEPSPDDTTGKSIDQATLETLEVNPFAAAKSQQGEQQRDKGTSTIGGAGGATIEFGGDDSTQQGEGALQADDFVVRDQGEHADSDPPAPKKPGTVALAGGATIDFDAEDESLAMVTSQWDDNVAGGTEDPHCTIKQKDTVGGSLESKSGSLVVKSRQVRSTKEPGGPILFPSDAPDYELIDVIGEGGMGVVYAARQSSIARTVAIKMLKDDDAGTDEQRDKFISEAVITGELDHPNIVPIYDLGANDAGALFYSMKRVKGTPWDDVIKQKSLDENINILLRVADAVAFAHVNGVIHRDLKPENVMLGDFGEVLVMDWGLARISPEFPNAESVTQSNSMGGTPAYMAPEMATGPIETITIASDIYLLGAMLFEVITGRPPHSGKSVMACLLAASKNKIHKTDKSGELMDIALKAMFTDPADRHATVREFQDAVRRYQEHSESILLTDHAGKHFVQAREQQDYDLFARCVYGFQEAIDLWDGNSRAKDLLIQAQLAYAEAALAKGDLDLGLSLLDEQEDEHATLINKLKEAVKERDQRQRRLQLLKGAVAALVTAVIVIVSIAFFAVRQQRNRARAAEAEAVKNFNEAEEARAKEEVAKQAAVKNFNDAEEARAEAVENFEAAEEARRLEEIAKQAAVDNFNAAEEARAVAVEARSAEEYAAYRARIGVANARIAENAFDRAKELLEQCPPHLRNWEWGRLNQLCCLSDSTWQLGSPVDAVAFAPDGNHFATGDWQGQAKVWNLETGLPIKTFDHGQYVHAVAYDRAGERLASASSDGTVNVYRVADGELLTSLVGHADAVLTVRFSPDGSRLLTGGYDNTARLWDAETGAELQQFQRHSWWVWAAEFSLDGQRIVTAGQDGKAIVWQRQRSEALLLSATDDRSQYVWKTELTVHRGPVYAARFTPDGSRIATAGYDGRVLVWDPDQIQPIDIGSRLDNLPDPRSPLKQLVGHRGPVRSLVFSSDGSRLASGGQDNTIIVWDVASGSERNRLRGHAGHVRSCSFSPSGELLLSASHDNEVKLWRPEKTSEVRVVGGSDLAQREAVLDARFSSDDRHIVAAGRDRTAALWTTDSLELVKRFVEGHEFLTSSAVFFTDGSRLATGAGDGTVRLWDVATGAEIHRLEGVGRTSALDVSPDGALVVTGSRNNSALLWDASTGEQVDELAGHRGDVTAVKFSADGRTLAIADERARCRVWRFHEDDNRWMHAATLEGHSRTINAVAFAQDGSRIVTASGDNTCGQWDVATGRELKQLVLKHPAWVSDLAVSDDGATALTSCDDGNVRIWSLDDGRMLDMIVPANIEAALTSIDLSPDGRLAATVSAAEGVVRLWDIEGRREITFADQQGEQQPWLAIAREGGVVWAARFTPAGDQLLTIGGNDARLMDVESRELAVRFSPHGAVASADLSPDGTLLVTGSWDRTAKIWDVATGRVQLKLEGGHDGFINSVAFSPAGESLLTASDDGTAKLWNPRTGAPLDAVLAGHEGRIRQARFSPDGDRIITASQDKTARVWDAQTGQLLTTLAGHEWAVRCAAFSSAGDRAITGGADNRAIIWNTETGELLATLSGHTSAVTAVALSPDGARAVTGSADNLVKVWDLEQAKELLTLTGHDDVVTSIEFSRDGQTILTSGRDGRLLLWTAAAWRDQ